MRMSVLAILIAGLMIAVEDPKEAGKKQSANDRFEDFQGFWTLVTETLDGKRTSQAETNQSRMTIWPDGKYDTRVIAGDGARIGTLASGDFKIDPAKNPKFIDISPTAGPDRGKTYRGIYELNDNELKVCTASPGKERPSDFTSKTGSSHQLFIWDDPARVDRKKLEGTWTVQSAEQKGKPVELFNKLIFAGIEFTQVSNGGPWKFFYSLDVKAQPQALDFWTLDLPQKAIYKIEKDKLYICLGDTKNRPDDFKSTTKAEILIVLKRDVPTDKKADK